jgi:squalene-hopene/tetraprenyl-beta-curcumene cyclase
MFRTCALASCFVAGVLAGDTPSPMVGSEPWSARAAADYLDSRVAWWVDWPHAGRDHQTFCVSCHTVVPYAMARPSLRRQPAPSALERTVRDNVTKRVRMWEDVDPFYGGPKSLESRGTEAVLNALILVGYEPPSGAVSSDTRLALDHMWAQQLTAGASAGAWPWLELQNAPWEGDSQYYGATLAALAVASAPADYRATAQVQGGIKLLRSYLLRDYENQILMDRLMLLWVSTKLSELLTPAQKILIVEETLSKQQADGGFSLSTFVGSWQRKDHTPLENRSDGYATGLVAVVLQEIGVATDELALRRALDWLRQNQQRNGGWVAYSLNKQNYLAPGAGRFMSDAATAYAVLALTRAVDRAALVSDGARRANGS